MILHEELLAIGYKLKYDNEAAYSRHTKYVKHNKEITIQSFVERPEHFHLYVRVQKKDHAVELIKMSNKVSEAVACIPLIKRFEKVSY